MSDGNIIRARLKPDGTIWQEMPDGSLQPFESQTDWERFDSMTDEEVEAAALSDPDNPPLTDEELARMMRVPNVQEIRERLGLTVEEFADRFALSPWQVKRWEAREEYVSWEIGLYLRVIDIHPEAVVDAIRVYRSPRAMPSADTNQEPEPMPRKKRRSA